MRVYSFPQGGILFEDPSAPSAAASEMSFLPNLVVVPLTQHSGEASTPVVKVGETVREGQLLARGQGAGQANIHAPIPGVVTQEAAWEVPGEGKKQALVVRLKGAFDILGKPQAAYSWADLSPFELRKSITEYGIVEMEAGGQPISDMLAMVHAVQGDITLVVRCVADDPWLAADFCLCRERAQAIAEGAAIAARAAQITRILIAVSPQEHALGRAILEGIQGFDMPVSIAAVGQRYPQRNRRELELVLRGYEAKEDLTLGALLFIGPATLAAIYDAVKYHRPILDRYVAVGGTAVANPKVLRVRIGSRFEELFAACGGFTSRPRTIVVGSPLLGRPAVSLDEPVTKTCYAVFALKAGPISDKGAEPCISCGDCRQVCPVGLDPEALYKGILDHKKTPAFLSRSRDCHGCGCCEVVCPSRIPLGTTIVKAAI